MVLLAYLSLITFMASAVMLLFNSSFISRRLFCWFLLLASRRGVIQDLTTILSLLSFWVSFPCPGIGLPYALPAKKFEACTFPVFIACLLCVRVEKLFLGHPQNNHSVISSGLGSRANPSFDLWCTSSSVRCADTLDGLARWRIQLRTHLPE